MPDFFMTGDKGQAPTVPYAVRGHGEVAHLSDRRPAVALVEEPETPNLPHEVDQLARELSDLQSRIAFLSGALEIDTAAAKSVGRIGISAEEIREEIRPLRAALREAGGDAA